MNNPPVDLDFSHKYDREHAEAYLKKHQDGLARKLSHRRDVQLARHALKLAGQPNLVLDLPCGAGRFWPLLAEKDNRVIIGADNSADMLAVACAGQPDGVVKRVRPLQTSAFAIDLPDSSVDNIFCMRLLHHIGEADDRRVLLREFHRVTRDSVILSLWVDGNFKAWKRRRMEARRVANGNRPATRTASCYQPKRSSASSATPASSSRSISISSRCITCGGSISCERNNDGSRSGIPATYLRRLRHRPVVAGTRQLGRGAQRAARRGQRRAAGVHRRWTAALSQAADRPRLPRLAAPFGYPTAMRERDALRAFESLGIRVPRLVYSGCRKVDGQWQALLVTEALEGFSSLDECYARGDQDRWGEAKHQRILQQIGATIARMNLAHWQHGCLYPKHIFVRVEGEAIEVALIDLEKSRRRLTVNKASQHDLKQLKRRSSWTGAQWQAFIYGYQTAFGSAIKGLQT